MHSQNHIKNMQKTIFVELPLHVKVSGQPDVYCEYSTTFTNMTELKREFGCIWRSLSSRTLL